MRKLLLDTNVLLRAFGAYPEDDRSNMCRQVFDNLIAGNKIIVVPTPVVAEMLRHEKPIELPIMKQIISVNFDRKAANILGNHGRMTVPDDQVGANKGYWKYDSMIMACAIASGVDTIVTLDKDYKGLVAQFEATNISIRNAANLVDQLLLPFEKKIDPTS